jgi:hypothetical protein
MFKADAQHASPGEAAAVAERPTKVRIVDAASDALARPFPES